VFVYSFAPVKRSLSRTLSLPGLVAGLFSRSLFLPLAFLLITFACPAQTNVLTSNYNNSRTGLNSGEKILTPLNVNSTQFGKLFSLAVDGQLYAQPLYLENVSINGAAHNVVIVATENDSVYAFDADSAGNPLWKASLVDIAHGAAVGATAVNSATDIGCTDLQPKVGVTSTPVIDPNSNTIYVEAKSKENGGFIHRLHALDLLTGAEKAPGPKVITATISAAGDGSSGGTLTFNSVHQLNRPGLLLLNGVIYIAYASHCDNSPYHGWLFAYDTAAFSQKGVLNFTPNGGLGGIWMSGAGLAADSSGNIFVPTGNGTFDNTGVELGDSIVKVALQNGVLKVLDYFAPFNQNTLNANDTDLGSGGLILLPDQSGSHPHLLVQAGKEGKIYLLNRDQLTTGNIHYCASNCNSTDAAIVQEIPSAVGGVYSSPTYFNGFVYFWGINDHLKAFSLTNGILNTSPTVSGTSYGFPGATPTISANGTSSGIVWSIDSSQYGSGPAVIYAHNAANVADELWNSAQAANYRDRAGNAVKFSVPTVANGKVYVGTSTELDVYGLLGTTPPQAATPVFSPAVGTYSGSVAVSITDSSSGATIFYTTDNSSPTTSSTKYTGAFTLTSSATVKAIATASGFGQSNIATAAYTLAFSKAAPPAINPASATYTGSVAVTITDSSSGASIFYTTDSSTPTTSSTRYSGPFSLTSSATVKAIATASGFSESNLAAAIYTVVAQAATPVFSPLAGTYTGAVGVSITDSSSGASIFYTTDSSTPTTSSTKYTGPFMLSSSATVKAIATASGFSQSNVATATYTRAPAPAATPVISPASATYTASVAVSITDSTRGASIFYTTDGSTPTASSKKYAGPFALTSSAMVRAMAMASGFTSSAVASSSFTMQPGSGTTSWYNSSWTYRNAVTLTNTSGASLSNFEVNVLLTTGFPFGSAKSDGSDLRVTASDGVTLIPFWVETWNAAGSSASVWVNVPTIATTGTTIYLYCGNAAATSVSSGSATFDFFDDFSGATLNTAKWTAYGGSWTIATDTRHDGTVGNVLSATTATRQILASSYTGGDYVLQAYGKQVSGRVWGVGVRVNTASNLYSENLYDDLDTTNNLYVYSWVNNPSVAATGTVANAAIGTVNASTWYQLMAKAHGNHIDVYKDGVLEVQGVDSSLATGGVALYGEVNTVAEFNNVFVRKYASVEPGVSVGGSTTQGGVALSAVTLSPVTVTGGTASQGTLTLTGNAPTGGAVVNLTSSNTAAAIVPASITIAGGSTSGTFTATSLAVSAATNVTITASYGNGTQSASVTVQSSTSAVNFTSGFTSNGLVLNGGAAINSARLRLTDAGINEARSAFFAAPVNIQSFTNDFSFQLTSPNADGFTFTIQDNNATALGAAGGALGYGVNAQTGGAGIPKSIAVKFDLYNNDGEGVNSTGMYTDGASPTVPFIDLTPSGVNLHSGDVFNVHMTYNGTTLTWTITDASTGKSFSTSAAVNIPSIVGSNTAFVGFTGGTGTNTAIQEIISWTFSTGSSKNPIQFETESLPGISSGPVYTVSAWPLFSGGSGTILYATKVGDSVIIDINVPSAGVYDVKYAAKMNNNRGISQLSVNDVNVGGVTDQYFANGAALREFDLGTVNLAAGNQPFKFTVTGKDSASYDFTISFDYIKLTPQ
jgi:hypothetical protein